MTGTDPATLARVDQYLATVSAAADCCTANLAAAITESGYEFAVMDFWCWLDTQPADARGWLAAVALAKLARQQLDSGPQPAAGGSEAEPGPQAGASGKMPAPRPRRPWHRFLSGHRRLLSRRRSRETARRMPPGTGGTEQRCPDER